MHPCLSSRVLVHLVFAAAAAAPCLMAQEWRKLTPATVPTGGLSMAYDAGRERVVLLGSARVGESPPLWEWDGSDWRVIPTSGGPSWGVITYDAVRRKLLCYDVFATTTWVLDGARWTQLFPQVSPPRSGTGNTAMTFDESRGVAVLHDGQLLFWRGIGTWEWDGVQWRQGSDRDDLGLTGLTYDHRRGVVVGTTFLGFDEWTGSAWSHREVVGVGRGVYDASIGEVVALSYLSNSELIAWNGSRSRVIPTNPGPSPYVAVLAHDTKRGRTILFDTFVGTLDTWEFVAYPAAYQTFGTGCPGTYGLPQLQQLPGQIPVVGHPFSVEVSNLPPIGVAYMVVGLSKTNWLGLPLPLPLDLIGMLGCTAYTDHIRVFPIVSVGGRAVWTTLVWNDPGRTFYNQAFVLDASANPFGLIVSNAGEGVIGY
jgi:hypothetical protein